MSKKIATRESYGNAVTELGNENEDIVVLDADLAAATKSGTFKGKHPERFFDVGIAEGNLAGIGAGLAAAGKIPFISTFAMFAAGRAFEQIRNSIGYPHLNVKIAATHGGISVGEDGATHQCLEDFGLMRLIPGMVVLSPADDTEAKKVVRAAAEYKGPVYIRFGRLAVPVLFDDNYQFEIGKGNLLREGSDLTLIATGLPVGATLEAAEKLAEEGIEAEVINMASLKPIDEELILESASKTGKVVTVEEHNIIGGLGSAVAEVLSENNPVRMLRIGIPDQYGKSGPAEELLAEFGLDADGIYTKIKDFLG